MVERIELRTERLLLRPFALSDVNAVLAYARDEEFARYYQLPEPFGRKNAEEEVARRVSDPWETEAMFAIMLEAGVIGEVYI